MNFCFRTLIVFALLHLSLGCAETSSLDVRRAETEAWREERREAERERVKVRWEQQQAERELALSDAARAVLTAEEAALVIRGAMPAGYVDHSYRELIFAMQKVVESDERWITAKAQLNDGLPELCARLRNSDPSAETIARSIVTMRRKQIIDMVDARGAVFAENKWKMEITPADWRTSIEDGVRTGALQMILLARSVDDPERD